MSSLKKYTHRPALRAVEVWRWISKDILAIKIVKRSPMFHLAEGKSVRQVWLRKTKTGIQRKTAVTYLRKGLFLVPAWKKVPQWEIKYLKEAGLSFCQQSILLVNGGYQRLIYMQVEDLDHTQRQQEHILDHYFEIEYLLQQTFPELFEKLTKEHQIIQKIGQRKIAADSLHAATQIRIDSLRRSLCSIVARAPLFNQAFSEKDRQTVISVLENAVREINSFTFRPINRPIGYARRSLSLAILHLKNNRLSLAKDRLRSAIKNLTYPTET